MRRPRNPADNRRYFASWIFPIFDRRANASAPPRARGSRAEPAVSARAEPLAGFKHRRLSRCEAADISM
jgi:hypothetical protein